MNNEPVAWINEDNFLLGDVLNSAVYRTKPNEEFTIPLYTHPAKILDLTDEEIKEVLLSNTRMSMCVWLSSGITKEEIEWFARAILRKAQEK